MTTPEDAGKTTRFGDAENLYPASQLERERAEDIAEFGVTAYRPNLPPVPVPMGDPIDDVTNPPARDGAT